MYHTRTRAHVGFSWPRLLPKSWAGAGLVLALLPALALGLTSGAQAVGAWTFLANQAPEPINAMLLLTDGTVIGQGVFTSGAVEGNGDTHWFKLTPDASGSYVNGTWTQIASMNSPRTYYASTVMRDGRVFVSGGEYTDSASVVDTNDTEIYDPVANTWTTIAPPPGWNNVGDAPVKSLFDGTVMLGNINGGLQALYNETTNTWATTGDKGVRAGEESWALLPDQSVLTVEDDNAPFAERYLPAGNSWVNAGQTPVDVVQVTSTEIGPAALLPNGMCLFIGATGHTALYDYTNASNPWMAGPDFPADGSGGLLEAKDAPGCVLVNGKVLCLVAPGAENFTYPNGQMFFEYAYDANGGTLTLAPDAGLFSSQLPAFTGRMLALPSGQVLFSNLNSQLSAYTPDGGPDPSWKPVVASVAANADGSYLVSGTQFNGISEGATYGDDASMSTNYPLVRLTDSAGVVTYARTFNHSTMGVATGSLSVSTNFTVPPGLAPGNYQLQVVANGIASDPTAFTIPATDVSSQITFTRGDFRYRPGTNTFAQIVTLTNSGSTTINGPINLALDFLSRNGRLANSSGKTSATSPRGNPYITVQSTSLAAGASISVLLSFSDLNYGRITYAARILSGNGV